MSAADKASGKSEKITITSEKGRISDAEIERMVKEAEEFAEQDKTDRENIEARNALEGYLYNLKSTAETMKEKISEEEASSLKTKIAEAFEWYESNPAASKDESEAKQKEVEAIANPIIQKAYQASNPNSEAGVNADTEQGTSSEYEAQPSSPSAEKEEVIDV